MPKETAREIVESLAVQPEKVSEVACFDSLLDDWYIIVGDMHKLGLTPTDMVDGLAVVHKANSMKAGTKDEAGKIVKQDGWEVYAPEPELQSILDRRKSL